MITLLLKYDNIDLLDNIIGLLFFRNTIFTLFINIIYEMHKRGRQFTHKRPHNYLFINIQHHCIL